MYKEYDLIIFDCDGTLVNSEEICNQALVNIVNQHVLKKYTLESALNNWAGHTVSSVIDLVQSEQDCMLPDDLPQRYVEVCNAQLKIGVKPIDHAVDFVRQTSDVMKVCVGSNGERQNVLDSLKLCGFSPSFFNEDNIFTRIQVTNGKPAPDLFLLAAEKMGVEPKRCLVIEDSPTGAAAGVAAGMDVFGFTGAAHDVEIQEKKLLDVGVKAVFNDFIHMAKVLEY